MRIKSIFTKRNILLFSIIGVLFVSCNPDAINEKGYGTLVISSSTSRTVEPNSVNGNITSYKVFIRKKDSGNEFSSYKSDTNDDYTIKEIESGEYEVYVEGYNAKNISILKSDIKTVQIVTKQTTNEVFKLNRFVAGTGQFNYTVFVPLREDTISYVSLSLSNMDGKRYFDYVLTDDCVLSKDGKYRCYTFNINVSAGSYIITVSMFKNTPNNSSEQVGISHVEALQVFKDTMSSGSLSWNKEFYPQVNSPFFDVDEGYCRDGQLLRLSTSNANAEIYYTTDGSDPTPSSSRYLNPIEINKCMTVKAISVVEGLLPSIISERSYKVKVQNPVFSIKDKSVVDYDDLEITSATNNARIIYTTDGTLPSQNNGQVYSEPIVIDRSMIVKAIAIKDFLESSDVVSMEYYSRNESSSDEFFSITNDGAISLNRNYKGTIPSVLVLPSSINGIEVSKIAQNGFAGEKQIINIVIPSTVERIGARAFKGCNNIESIDISEYVTSIDQSAFSGWSSNQKINDYSGLIKAGSLIDCDAKIYATVKVGTQVVSGYTGMSNLYGIYMTNNITTIAPNAFSGCINLEEFTLPEFVTSIGELAFNECKNIKSITIPAVLKNLANDAFRGWTNEQTIIDERNRVTERLSESEAKVYTRISPSVTVITSDMVRNRDDIYGLEIPSSVEEIADNAFEGTNIEKIVIPSTVKKIGLEVFKGWKDNQKVEIIYNNYDAMTDSGRTSFSESNAVYEVSFVENLEAIKANAFNGMKSLDYIDIPSTVKKIDERAFMGTSLRNIKFSNNVYSIGDECFADCLALEEVDLGESVTSIPMKVFNNTPRLSTIIAPNAMCSIDVEIKIPLNQLIVSDIRVSVHPSYGTCFDGFTTEFSRSQQTIEGNWRIFKFSVPNALALYYSIDAEMLDYTGSKVGTVSIKDNCVYPDILNSITVCIPSNAISSRTLGSPSISPSSGVILDGQCVTIAADDADAIYYTLDGTEPSEFNGILYDNPIILHSLKNIKAVAIKEGYSYAYSNSYYHDIKVVPPVFSFDPSLKYPSTQNVKISTDTDGATIKYTLDGSDPVLKGIDYKEPIEISKTTRIKAIACKNGFVNSEIADATITIDIPNHEIENPVERKLTIKKSNTEDGIMFEAIITPSIGNVIYKWYVDGEYVGDNSYYVYCGSFGYHLIEVQAYVDNCSYSCDDTFYNELYFYKVELNNEWIKDVSYSNPNSSLFDGVYKSDSNYHIANSSATMKIYVKSPGNFRIYVRSNGEAYSDYANVYELDSNLSIKYSTRETPNSSKGLSGYSAIDFYIPDDMKTHVITITYIKDSAINRNEDRAFVLIPKYIIHEDTI